MKKKPILPGITTKDFNAANLAVDSLESFVRNLHHSPIEKLNLTAITPHMQGGVCHNFHQFALLFAPGNCSAAKVYGRFSSHDLI